MDHIVAFMPALGSNAETLSTLQPRANIECGRVVRDGYNQM
jgi:hypothetical protein